MKPSPRIVCLSNVIDDQYRAARGETVPTCLSKAKRQDLFQCFELATGREVVLLSSPPKALDRHAGRWLPAVESRFSTHRQLFCCNWDYPKLRVPLSWGFYARHVASNLQEGDIVILDNYELIYVLAACIAQTQHRRICFVLDFEDGKHLICRGLDKVVSDFAELLGKRLIRGALLAHPGLAARLPSGIPTEVVPGFIAPKKGTEHARGPLHPVRFFYSGSLDAPRGIDVILRALELLPPNGWHLDITGSGAFSGEVTRLAESPRFADRVRFHGALAQAAYDQLAAECHVGLNCQRPGDPISSVTFPSKVFSYLSAGLHVLSTKASGVPDICGTACIYVPEDTPESLANSMGSIIADPVSAFASVDPSHSREKFSIQGTADRLRGFFARIQVSQ